MPSLNLRLAQQIPVQRQSHRIVYYQNQKLRKPRTLGPPEDERSFLQNRRKQRIGRKSIRLPPIPRLEKNLCPKSVGIVEKRKIRQATVKKYGCEQVDCTLATFTEVAETLTEFRVHSEPRKRIETRAQPTSEESDHKSSWGDTRPSELTSSSRSWAHHQKRSCRISEYHRTRASESKRTQGR